MSSQHIPARDIPIPSYLSPEAQGALAAGALDSRPWPPPGDVEAWRRTIRTRDEELVSLLQLVAAGITADTSAIDISGVVVHQVVPVGAPEDRVVLDLHGGALILLGGAACGLMTAIAAARTGLPTWGVDYRMPPDHPYPAGLDDCLVVYRRLLDERPPDRIVVSGGSAGGNLAAALVVRARDEGLALPAAVVLQTPEVDLTESGDSFSTNLGVDTTLGPLKPVNELYADGHDLTHPYLSPLFADLTGFPPTILTTGTRDLFLSNTVRMHRALRRAGVRADLHVLDAGPHAGFFGGAPEEQEITGEIRSFIDEHCPPTA